MIVWVVEVLFSCRCGSEELWVVDIVISQPRFDVNHVNVIMSVAKYCCCQVINLGATVLK